MSSVANVIHPAPANPAAKSALRDALLAHMRGEIDAAERSYRLAMNDPPTAERARFHLAQLFEAAQRWEDAVEVRRALCAAAPNSAEYHLGLAEALLRLGRFAEGWRHYEARRGARRPYRPPTNYPEWDGRTVASLVVFDEQGAGDAIQFLRFLPRLQERGIAVTFVGRAELTALVEAMGVPAIAGEGLPQAPPADAWVMLGSLPLRLGVTIEALSGAPYLKVPRERAAAWSKRLAPTFEIGIVGSGNRIHARDADRSLSPEGRSWLATLPGAISLTREDFPLPLADFADTAAVVARMKLIVTVDTAVAHLAGALGKPCWLLLSSAFHEWRWLQGRSDSPWYDSIRIYRQPRAGDWATVLGQVGRDLPGFLAATKA